MAEHDGGPTHGREETCNNPQQRRLSGAICTLEMKNLSGSHVEIGSGKCGIGAKHTDDIPQPHEWFISAVQARQVYEGCGDAVEVRHGWVSGTFEL